MTQEQIDELAKGIYHRFVNYEWNEVSGQLKKSIIDAIKAGYAAAPAYKGDEAWNIILNDYAMSRSLELSEVRTLLPFVQWLKDAKASIPTQPNSVHEGEKEAVEGWISVEDGLPDYENEVLVFGTMLQRSPKMGGNPPVVVITMRQDLKGSLLEKNKRRYLDENDFRHFDKVTHWMTLPAPPQQ